MKNFLLIGFLLSCGGLLAQEQEDYLLDCTLLDSMYRLIEQKKINIESPIGCSFLYGNTPLTLSCSCGSNYLQKKYNISVNYVCPNLNHPLIYYVLESQNKTLIDSFIQQGANLNQWDERERTLPISVVAHRYKDTLLIQHLLEKGASFYYPEDSLATLRNTIYNDNSEVFFSFGAN